MAKRATNTMMNFILIEDIFVRGSLEELLRLNDTLYGFDVTIYTKLTFVFLVRRDLEHFACISKSLKFYSSDV